MSEVTTPVAANDAAPNPNLRKLAKATTRAKVLEAGRELFDERGYEAATIRAVARRVGMSTGAVFASFTDKADLYRAVYGHDPLTPEQGIKLAAALREAEAFIAGFEGDELQSNIDALLWQTRSALVLTEPKPVAKSDNKPALPVGLKEAA